MNGASPFSSRAVLAMLAVGAAAFVLSLYAVGAGWGAHDSNAGSGHAASNGLNGYAALVELLERRGQAVSISHNRGRLHERALLVLTPQHGTNARALSRLLAARRDEGPTLVILPKWYAADLGALPGAPKVRRGWVELGDATSPEWLGKLAYFDRAAVQLVTATGWRALGIAGRLPSAKAQVIGGPGLAPLVTDDQGRALAAFLDDGGYYPTLLPLAGRPVDKNAAQRWALTIVAEPDLLNNQGLADPARARLAAGLVLAAREDPQLPIVFDVTLAGLGRSDNLLTLAFEPPFLAATLCLLLAAVLVAWRGLTRFGPPAAEQPSGALGKRQLARNGAALIERSRRWHLLGPPYAALLAGRIAARLGIREAQPEARDRAAAEALRRRGLADDYPAFLAALEQARRTVELVRAGSALTAIERALAP